ncbi:hypothetical protein PBY51_017951 [Eleginops maclovinus]|uniref:Uncharacterized protein n=1 Tax=Eleginops maclovinus TaxID=56733 RepID=A0AAN7XKQ9_ELEMC|nr:hypothetical protein PBY51_017951 [Eleginops maclovinus]
MGLRPHETTSKTARGPWFPVYHCSRLINIWLTPPPPPPCATPHRPGIASAPWLSHHRVGRGPGSYYWLLGCCITDSFTGGPRPQRMCVSAALFICLQRTMCLVST